MTDDKYDPHWVESHFDSFGMQEWDRLVASPSDEISLHVHNYYLENAIRPGMRVLEIGAGAGRFTQTLARLEARITIGDLSAVQLELNRTMGERHGFQEAVDAYHQVDVCSMPMFEDESFDAVVAYGGVFSYTLDRRDKALAECRRVTKPGGALLASVMSLWGTCHRHLPGVMVLPAKKNEMILSTGDLLPETVGAEGNRMHLFRPEELMFWLQQAGWEVMRQSASGVLGLVWTDDLDAIRNDAKKWKALLAMEVEACREKHALAMGTHLIVEAVKPLTGRGEASPMEIDFQEVFFRDNQCFTGERKRVQVPFSRVTARAIVLRQKDGAILGTQHHTDAPFALPGGAMEDGETAEQAVIRELEEENIRLISANADWRTRVGVDSYAGYGELSIWFVIVVEDAEVHHSYENIITRWVQPEEDVWYPHLRDRIRNLILRSAPAAVSEIWQNKE